MRGRSPIVQLALAAGAVVSALATDASAGRSAETQSPLVGTWRTPVISQADAEATLRRHGLSKWIVRFRSQTPITEPMSLVLVITPKEWDLYGKPKGKPRTEIDYDAEHVVRRTTVDKIHKTGVTTLRWSVKGRNLTLRWIRTTEPAFMGVPDEVFQYALYMTRVFSRVR